MLRLHGAVVAIADLEVNAVTVWGEWMWKHIWSH